MCIGRMMREQTEAIEKDWGTNVWKLERVRELL